MLGRCRQAARGAQRILMVGMLTTIATLMFAGSAAAEGNFVIGDGNASAGTNVTFWGAKWRKDNSLSGGLAPASFKGFADTSGTPPACGETWTSHPGDSSEPPAGPLPELIEVIVASQITKSGRTISGDTKEVVLVQTEPGYAPDPGHPGTGTVIARICHTGGGGGPG
jgi:hypothetical protein